MFILEWTFSSECSEGTTDSGPIEILQPSDLGERDSITIIINLGWQQLQVSRRELDVPLVGEILMRAYKPSGIIRKASDIRGTLGMPVSKR